MTSALDLDKCQRNHHTRGEPVWLNRARAGLPTYVWAPVSHAFAGFTQTDEPRGAYVSSQARPEAREARSTDERPKKCVRSIELERSGSRR